MGYSFAAGTIDGPGSFSFEQGTTTANPMWNAVRNLLAAPTTDDVKCHGAKPILLATGRVSSNMCRRILLQDSVTAFRGKMFLIRIRNFFLNKFLKIVKLKKKLSPQFVKY